MKKAFFLTGLAAVSLAAPPRAATGEPPAPAQAAPPAAAPAPRAPTPQELEASRRAIAGADVGRLLSDRDYAAAMLVHLDRIAPLVESDVEARLAFGNLRLFALQTQQRPDDVRAGIDAMLAERPAVGDWYAASWFGALGIQDWDRALTVVETASRNVPGVGWGDLRSIFEVDAVNVVLRHFHGTHQEEKRVRMAEALFRIGWTGGGDAETADFIRSILVQDRLGRHDNEAASNLAAGITTPSQTLSIVTQARFDPVLPPGRDRLDLLRESLARRDRETAEALAAAPRDVRRVLDRVQYLRGLGRDADALALVMPFTRDVRATVAAGREGMWVINEGGYALADLGRGDEAVALMRRLLALPVAENIHLIGPSINQAEIFNAAGRYADALDHARRLQQGDARYANDYGRMWISASVVCALAGLSRPAEAAAELALMRPQSDTNPAALTRAYLCAGDDDAAAALIVHRLQSDDSESAILALQSYGLSQAAGQEAALVTRLMVLRDRPEVRDALGRVGHVLVLPLARTYWGGF